MEYFIVLVLIIVGIFLLTGLFGAPYVPSKRRELEQVFVKLKPLGAKDVVVDFGCGDGVVLIAAARAEAGRVVGVELNPILAMVAKWRCRKYENIEVRCGNMLGVKLPEDMSLAYVFGLDRVMRMILPRLSRFAREQGRDVLVVSLAFGFPEIKAEKTWGAYGLYRIRAV